MVFYLILLLIQFLLMVNVGILLNIFFKQINLKTKPAFPLGIGVDAIPQKIRNSNILTGNNLGQLGNVEKLPGKEDVLAYKNEFLKNVSGEDQVHTLAKKLLDEGRVEEGWKVLLSANL